MNYVRGGERPCVDWKKIDEEYSESIIRLTEKYK